MTEKELAARLLMELGFQIITDHSADGSITTEEVSESKVRLFDRIVEPYASELAVEWNDDEVGS